MHCGIFSLITSTAARLRADGIKDTFDVAKNEESVQKQGGADRFYFSAKKGAGTRRKRRKRISQLRKSGPKCIKNSL